MNNNRLQLQRIRNLGEVISDSFAFQMPNWRTFAAVAGPAVMVGILLQLVLFLLMPDQDRFNDPALTDEEARELLADTFVAIVPLIILLPVMWVIYQLTAAGIVVLLRAFGDGRPVAAGDALDAAQDRAKDLLIASLKSTLILVLLMITIVGIPFAIYRAIRWSLIVQGIMVDGVTHREALSHSANLVEGVWWYTLGRLTIASLVITIPGTIATSIIGGIIPGVPGILLAGCVGFLTYPYPIIATTLIFFDRKARMAEARDVAPGL